MLHWIPPLNTAFVGARDARGPALPGDPSGQPATSSPRATHALMLAYAAQRRRAAAEPGDALYWKAAESHALHKARLLRNNGLFPRLP